MADLQPPNDLGFGNRLAEESKARLLNRAIPATPRAGTSVLRQSSPHDARFAANSGARSADQTARRPCGSRASRSRRSPSPA